MSLITFQINPTDKFEVKQAKEMLETALLEILKEEKEREKLYEGLGKLPKLK